MGSITDQKFKNWAQKIRVSDEGAFSELFHAVYPRMIKFAWRYTRNKSSAHDVVQESMLKLWDVRKNIDPEKSLRAYLYQIVRSRALNHIRGKKEYTPIEDANSDRLQVESRALENVIDGKAHDQKMTEFIEQLPGRQREAIQLSRFEGLDHDEIADVMDISPRTVNNHIVTALKTLREKWNLYKSNQAG